VLSAGRDIASRGEHELAGGIEDWEDVQGHDVDRYGFIQVRRRNSINPEYRPPQRVSTVSSPIGHPNTH
jgi:hypothetical protein